MIKDFVFLIRENTQWLYAIIYQNDLFFIDFWSILHFVSGFLISCILISFGTNRILAKLILLLISYELIEISLYFYSLNIFKPEILKDQITDILLGILGGVSFLALSLTSKKIIKENISQLLSAFLITFIWVGFYGYKYNIEYFNTIGLNIWSFTLWFIASTSILIFYDFIDSKVSKKILSITILYLVYLISLFSLEIIGQELLNIHEISKRNATPLIFNLIHGNIYLHIFYLSSPLILLTTNFVISSLINKALTKFEYSLDNPLLIFNDIYSKLKDIISQ
ncbi:MAG: hypothetical protein NZM09_11525 [Ignavibacterium sp.]|nr:hypothetical protein [Ignavibacterium sp.]MDW8376308.1 hypothetical protein [Ignavibacteriales bacterium]